MGDVVITCLLTANPDPQRGVKWSPDPHLLTELAGSLGRHGVPFIVLHDEVEAVPDWQGVDFVKVPAGGNPYFHRWRVIADWLAAAAVERVWCVDGTDVEMLHDPFPHMEPEVVYCGSELLSVGTPWMRQHHPGSAEWIEVNRYAPLLNAGVLGGGGTDVQEIAARVFDVCPVEDQTDMAAFNRVLHSWPGVVETGSRVHTVMNAWDRSSSAWWRHK